MELAGYLASLFIGITLGVTGGGGSVLAVPVLVYLFRVQPVVATAYSLFIVGSTSLVGSYRKYQLGQINLKTVVIFGTPSIAAAYLTRAFLVPAIPENIVMAGSWVITKSLLIMIIFAVLMVFAAVSMIKDRRIPARESQIQPFNYPLILIEGMLVGTLTGLVGAGGGFLIIPALVLQSKLPMKEAVGTSLLIIAAQSLIGFTGGIGKQLINWSLLFKITGLAIVGILIGNKLSKTVSATNLKKGFGWFLVVMGTYIIVKEIWFPIPHVNH